MWWLPSIVHAGATQFAAFVQVMTLGLVFHLGIALALGLISFAFSAFGLLVFACGYAFHHELVYLVNSRDYLLGMEQDRTIQS